MDLINSTIDYFLAGLSDSVVENATADEYQPSRSPYFWFRERVNHVIIPIICMIGILGNLFNCYVFYCRWYQKFMNETEKSITMGLISLSISDAMFCLATLPSLLQYYPFTVEWKSHSISIFRLYYKTYKPFFVNLFLLNSTWLITTISLQRLISVTWTRHPFYSIIRSRVTLFTHLLIFFLSFLVCLPLLLRHYIVVESCYENNSCYIVHSSKIINNSSFLIFYRIFWLIFGTVLPLVLLAFTNVRLILIICNRRFSDRIASADGCRFERSQITLLVVVMITSFLLLVCPSMIVECLTWIANSPSLYGPHTSPSLSSISSYFSSYSTSSLTSSFTTSSYFPSPSSSSGQGVIDGQKLLVAIAVTNLLQSIKFSLNFLLYCSVNRQFRRELRACRVKDSCRASRDNIDLVYPR